MLVIVQGDREVGEVIIFSMLGSSSEGHHIDVGGTAYYS